MAATRSSDEPNSAEACTVLVADDQEIFREPIAAVLREHGFKTLLASNGQEALQAALAHHPDAILIELAMPGMDGVRWLRALRANIRTKSTPVLALSAVARREVIESARRAGLDDYLLKTRFSVDDLLLRIRKCTRPGTAARGAPRLPAISGTPAAPDAAAAVADVQVPALTRNEVLERLRSHAELHPMPAVLRHVLATTNNAAASVNEIVAAVRLDQALVLKVMRVANSSLYSSGARAHNPTEAVRRIGIAGVRNAVAAITAIDHFGQVAVGGLNLDRFWQHSLATALLAQQIAAACKAPNGDDVFLAGLLHDAGRLMLGTLFPEQCAAALAAAGARGVSPSVTERELFGLSHSDATREVLRIWETPAPIIEAASDHFQAADKLRRSRDAVAGLSVALANRLAHALLLGDSGAPSLLDVQAHARGLELDDSILRPIATTAVERTEDVTLFYSSQGTGPAIESVASELAKSADGPVKAAVLSSSTCSPLALFCEQLRWLDEDDPELALIDLTAESDVGPRLSELAALEQRVERELPVLIASLTDKLSVRPEQLASERCTMVRIPIRYTALVDAILRTRALAPAAAS